MSLNIRTLTKGQCVCVTPVTAQNGNEEDRKCLKHKINSECMVYFQVYHIEQWDIHDWHTVVYLQEFPNIPFNSVNFEECQTN